jgi:hypothetical protein
MITKQVVKILTESFLNCEFHVNALAHVLEINQFVSAQNTIKLLDLIAVDFCSQNFTDLQEI